MKSNLQCLLDLLNISQAEFALKLSLDRSSINRAVHHPDKLSKPIKIMITDKVNYLIIQYLEKNKKFDSRSIFPQ
jgi:hypothetical protein